MLRIKPFLLTSAFVFNAQAVTLNVNVHQQEHDQWCWAGTSAALLEYYGKASPQCQIVNYAWGTDPQWRYDKTPGQFYPNTDCCNSTNANTTSCNYWNYMNYYDGSIEDILREWGVNSTPSASPLTLNQSLNEINAGAPFYIRWGWNDGSGGHFVLGHGLESNGTMTIMDPWFGEGKIITTHAWVTGSDSHPHKWTHTLTTDVPTPQSSQAQSSQIVITSSANIGDVDCSGLPAWQAKDYNYQDPEECVVYQNQKYCHVNWVNSTAPNLNSTWTLRGNCIAQFSSATTQSSEILPNSSIQASSSAQVYSSIGQIASSLVQVFSSDEAPSSATTDIQAVEMEQNFQIDEFNSQGMFIQTNSPVQVYVLKSNGSVQKKWLITADQYIQWDLAPGSYFVALRSRTESRSIPLSINQ